MGAEVCEFYCGFKLKINKKKFWGWVGEGWSK